MFCGVFVHLILCCILVEHTIKGEFEVLCASMTWHCSHNNKNEGDGPYFLYMNVMNMLRTLPDKKEAKRRVEAERELPQSSGESMSGFLFDNVMEKISLTTLSHAKTRFEQQNAPIIPLRWLGSSSDGSNTNTFSSITRTRILCGSARSRSASGRTLLARIRSVNWNFTARRARGYRTATIMFAFFSSVLPLPPSFRSGFAANLAAVVLRTIMNDFNAFRTTWMQGIDATKYNTATSWPPQQDRFKPSLVDMHKCPAFTVH